MGSASQVLEPKGGLIQVALCEGQGGATASCEREWKQSWMAALYAAEHGLLLRRVEPFEVNYNKSLAFRFSVCDSNLSLTRPISFDILSS